MKSKLTLTIEEDLIPKAKQYAQAQGVSLSQLIENTLRDLEVDQHETFSSRWRGKFQKADVENTRFKALEEKYLR